MAIANSRKESLNTFSHSVVNNDVVVNRGVILHSTKLMYIDNNIAEQFCDNRNYMDRTSTL
jgi:hypothetical protein